jgi:uncharacterized membrane protein
MAQSEISALKELVKKQSVQIRILSGRLNKVESALVKNPESGYEPVVEDVEEPVVEKKREVHAGRENPASLFKVFGIIGVILIVLGSIYFYKYAVDNGWIGIAGRIALGVVSALIILVAGIVMNLRKYENFSQVLISCGLGVLYFTVFATYHFHEYRAALGMSLVFNTILLLFVMLGGAVLGVRLNARWVVYGALLLGYIAAFLSGIEGRTLHILIYVLVMDLVVFAVAKFKAWCTGIPAQVLSYIAYAVWYVQGVVDSRSIINQTGMPVLVTLGFLFAYYALFTLLSFVQEAVHKKGEAYAFATINTVAAAGFGLGVVYKYYPDFNGLYLLAVSALTLLVGFAAKKFHSENIFDAHFLFTCILVGIAVPVQFDKTIVTVLWVVMSLGLAFGGMKVNHARLFYVGYIGYVVPLARCFFFDLWFLDNTAERIIAVSSVIFGVLAVQLIANKFLSKSGGHSSAFNIYSCVASVIVPVWVAREIYGIESLLWQTRHVLVSVGWALLAVMMIFYGISNRRKMFNWCGVVLFGIVVLKVLTVDLSELDNIFRVLALVIVGVIALVGSFIFVRNKEKIKGLI